MRDAKLFRKIVPLILVVIFALFVFMVPEPAHAWWPASAVANALTDLAAGLLGWIAFGINYFVAMVVGLFIGLVTYFIGVILQLNTHVVNSLAVKGGFQVTLAIANLGFVLGIIVIAIATILRRESYGIKKTLWKLVFAAILVNFSLVIGGAIINFADQFTNSFLGIVPGGGGGTDAYFNFANKLASGFSPQRALLNGFLEPTKNASNISGGATGGGTIGQGSSQFGGQVASLITPVFSVVFTVAMLIIILIVLVVFLFMLLIRYVYLTILLILMPFAWLLWIFPQTSKHWSKWWNAFFRWTFFAPIVVFFLYLAIATAGTMGAITSGPNADPAAGLSGLGYQPQTNNPVASAVSGFIGGFANTLIGTFLQMFVVVGLAVGGMIAANSMSITGAGVAVSAVSGAANKVKGYALDKTKQTGRWAARKTGIDTAVQRMRSGEVGVGAFKKVPLVGSAADWAVKRGASVVGRAVEPSLSNKDLVEKARKAVPDDLEKIKENLRGNMNTQDNLAHVAKLIEKGELSEDQMVKGKKAKDYLDENKELFEEGYGQGKVLKDADKAMGGNKAMRDMEKDIVALEAAGRDTSAALIQLDAATKEFVEKLEKGDMSKMNVNAVFGKDSPTSRSLARTLATVAPQLISGAMPKMKSPTLEKFRSVFTEELEREKRTDLNKKKTIILANKTLTNEEKQRIIDNQLPDTESQRRLKYAERTFKRAYANNVLSLGRGGREEEEGKPEKGDAAAAQPSK
jgi:hypothetical protein